MQLYLNYCIASLFSDLDSFSRFPSLLYVCVLCVFLCVFMCLAHYYQFSIKLT